MLIGYYVSPMTRIAYDSDMYIVLVQLLTSFFYFNRALHQSGSGGTSKGDGKRSAGASGVDSSSGKNAGGQGVGEEAASVNGTSEAMGGTVYGVLFVGAVAALWGIARAMKTEESA